MMLNTTTFFLRRCASRKYLSRTSSGGLPLQQRMQVAVAGGTRKRPLSRSSSSSVVSSRYLDYEDFQGDDDSGIDPDLMPIVELKDAVLSHPNSSTSASSSADKKGPWDVAVYPPSEGGHVVLGRNGAGKSLLSSALTSYGDPDILKEGIFRTTGKGWHPGAVAHVSFESHESLLQVEGLTMYKAISGGGNLSKAAQFLIVRFGLYPMLHRDVNTLSTGEIRKVMLVRALARRPRLLVLDNAFDGLDVPSRQKLKDLVSKTIMGFRADILVQGISAKATAHTQVVLITHREEEIVDEVEFVTMWDSDDGEEQENGGGRIRTFRRNGEKSHDLMARALNIDAESVLCREPWEDTSLPSLDEVAACWRSSGGGSGSSRPDGGDTIVRATNLTVRRGDAVLIDDLNLTVRSGERWLVAGGNGAGKSTLSRLLAKHEDGILDQNSLLVDVGMDDSASSPSNEHKRRDGVGWVSTELHMATARSTLSVRQVLQGDMEVASGSSQSDDVVSTVASWLGLDGEELLSCPFSALSQGQQKLALIGAAIVARPSVIVLDEPCQGLDVVNRRRVLGLVERLCQATDVSLIYITHHMEELLPSVTNVLHMSKGRAVYNGSRADYDPAAYQTDDPEL